MTRPRRCAARRLLAAGALAALAAVAVGSAGPAPAAAAGPPAVSFVPTVSGLEQPTQVTSARDGSGRLFVAEKAGRVRVVVHGRLLARPFLDLSSRVRADGEGGLLSVAFRPGYRAHPDVWVAYTDTAGDLRVARFHARSAGSNTVPLSSYRRVIDVPHPTFTNHYGGQLVFGRTGLLFLSTGDGGSAGDPSNHAPDRGSLAGKILRLRVIGAARACGRPYCVPAGNPFAGRTPGRGEIWALGLRNAWRFSVDRATGDLWVGDVGQDRVEEVDHLPATGAGGRNLGWSCVEGTTTYDASRCAAGTRYLAPVWTYDHGYGQAVIGGFVYRGSRYRAQLGGSYLGGDEVSGRVFVGGPGGGVTTVGHLDGVTSFGEDGDNELWAVSIATGSLYKVVVT